MSEEIRAKLSAARKGKPSNRAGKKLSEETKAKISAANKGMKHSEDTKAKMSVAKKSYYQKKKETR